MADETTSNDELVINFDLDGLAALMKAIEAAIASGHDRVGPGRGVAVTRGGPGPFTGVTLTFTEHGSGLALAV